MNSTTNFEPPELMRPLLAAGICLVSSTYAYDGPDQVIRSLAMALWIVSTVYLAAIVCRRTV